MVTLGDLEHRDGRLVAWLDGRPRAVDVVYLRTDEDRFTGEDGTPTAIGEALLEPAAAGTARGGERAGVGRGRRQARAAAAWTTWSASTWTRSRSCPRFPPRVVGPDDELDDLVVKPRGEMGGEDVVIWRDADERDARAGAGADRGRAGRLDRAGAGAAVGAPDR